MMGYMMEILTISFTVTFIALGLWSKAVTVRGAMQTEAQRRATSNYRKKVKQLTLRFYPNSDADEEMYEWLKSQDNTTDYIKKLISADMQNRG